MSAPEWKEQAYQAVWQSGLLTQDADLNARIWRAVETALKTVENGPSDWLKYLMPVRQQEDPQ